VRNGTSVSHRLGIQPQSVCRRWTCIRCVPVQSEQHFWWFLAQQRPPIRQTDEDKGIKIIAIWIPGRVISSRKAFAARHLKAEDRVMASR